MLQEYVYTGGLCLPEIFCDTRTEEPSNAAKLIDLGSGSARCNDIIDIHHPLSDVFAHVTEPLAALQ